MDRLLNFSESQLHPCTKKGLNLGSFLVVTYLTPYFII